jgi:3-hydroxyacyl-CoA dehydrogenase
MIEISESVSYVVESGVAVVAVDNPPVNALSHHVRRGILDAMQRASTDDAAEAVVLVCEGRTFIAGADITEFGSAPMEPSLPDMQLAIENCSKPVVAAIHGTALGGGLEVAMCAHHRVAVASAKLGLPEVRLGLLPGAGGTQRLPRFVGVEKALDMVTSGTPIDANEALEHGLVDAIVEDLRADAIAFAQSAVSGPNPLRKIRDVDDKLVAARSNRQPFDAIRKGIARKTRGFDAPEANIACIEAAVDLPFEEGLGVERERFLELMSGSQSAAQRYYFFAEREAAKVPGLAKDTPKIDVETAGVLGAGTMGGGIAMNFANAGIPVTIVERDQESLDRGLAVVRKNYERSASRGRISAADVEERMSLITGSVNRSDFADCDVVIEAVFENLDLKREIFGDLDAICKPGAILASNTSALDINDIAAATSRPESVIGMHFFSPANVMALLENVRGGKTSDTVIASVMALSKRIGKVPALVGVCHGFVGNRMLFQRRVEANQMVLEGATPAQVDRVLFDFGFPMGPFAMSDLAGLDIGWNAETSTGETLRDVMCESGRRGQKNGRGYYVYDPETRASTPDPEVEQLIRDFAEARGIEQREITDDEVLERSLYSMVNEGAKIIEEGIASRASDVDVVWVNGYGWPRYRGGPMFWADLVGLDEIVSTINDFSERFGSETWELSPLLAKLASEGGTLHTATAPS